MDYKKTFFNSKKTQNIEHVKIIDIEKHRLKKIFSFAQFFSACKKRVFRVLLHVFDLGRDFERNVFMLL